MATTGPRIYPGASTYPGSSLYAGQGMLPRIQALYSTEPVASPPDWQYVPEGNIRSWTVTRGRDSELAEIDAGTASVVIDNTDRTFDPTENTDVGPMNRWWLRVQFDGTTEDVFVGYAESYDQQWPGKGADAVTVVSLVDEFKVLALDALPTTNPPRDTYRDVVLYDEPSGYWEMNGQAGQQEAVVGTQLAVVLGTPPTTQYQSGVGAIVGDESTATFLASGFQNSTSYYSTGDQEPGAPGDFAGLDDFAVELWMEPSRIPSVNEQLASGPLESGGTFSQWNYAFLTTGAVSFVAYNSSGTSHTVTSSTTAVAVNEWSHLVASCDGSTLRLYVNGVQEATTAWSGVHDTPTNPYASLRLGPGLGGVTPNGARMYAHVAVYRHNLTADRVLAHYEAGRERGLEVAQLPGYRAGLILDSVTSTAPRRLHDGSRYMSPSYMKGQNLLSELRETAAAESPDGLLFIAKDGAVVLFDADHRNSSPWNTAQATFDDDGTDLPYFDIDIDYSEAFLVNEWNVSGFSGKLQTESDATSIARYFKRSQGATGLPVYLDADAATIAADLLAKYKDPHFRIVRLVLSANRPEIAAAVFAREIGDMIQVYRTPPGGGDRIDQALYIQKIDISANPGEWVVTWGVSPL